jgi:energy-coupling factor transporter ATP-binding protein EcfA2
MNVDGKLVAVVGPNEAGKTSFLQALTHLNHSDTFNLSGASRETTRSVTIPADQPVVSARFLLGDDDWEALSEVQGGQDIRWCTVSKRAEYGTHYYRLSPGPQRSLQPRQRVVRLLSEVSSRQGFQKIAEEYEESDLAAEVESLAATLNTEVQTMQAEALEEIRSVAVTLKDAMSDGGYRYIRDLAQDLHDLVEHETGDPVQQTINVLSERKPKFLLFSDDKRHLRSEYDLDEVWQDPPAALGNLAQLADLDLQALHTATAANDSPEVESILVQANRQLKRTFYEVWSQSDVTVRFRTDEQVLRVLVQEETSEDSTVRFTSIDERSDGLRQFVALVAFADANPLEQVPILLIDEIETHLHYDAQADLVQMLSKQEIVEKVIYTTHSIGCLPEDLGTGVRLIESLEPKSYTSLIKNAFWTSNSSGFSPLLFGMGASTLAFVPLRNAVIAEGPSDMILWPTLLREATGRTHLDFQVAPGLSKADRREIIVLDREAPRTAYLLDSDEGGNEQRGKLRGAGISEDKILAVPDNQGQGLVIEDLIDEEVYVRAVNEELHRSHGSDYSFPAERLPVAGRPAEVETWCSEKGISAPKKTAVAYRVLEEGIDRSVLAERYCGPLEQLFRDIIPFRAIDVITPPRPPPTKNIR